MEPSGTETDPAWSDLQRLPVEDRYRALVWTYRQLEVFSSGHAEVLLQVGANPEVAFPQKPLLSVPGYMYSGSSCHSTKGASDTVAREALKPLLAAAIQLHAVVAQDAT